MRDIRLIHASEDVPRVLGHARELGMVILDDSPTSTPAPRFVQDDQIDNYKKGSFIMYLPEWVFGKPEFSQIGGGYNKGKFFRHPNWNNTSIGISFFGERMDGTVKRLGSGDMSRNVEWYRSTDHSVHRAPSSVEEVFDALWKRINTGKYLRGGGFRYWVLEKAWDKLSRDVVMPPFDYIEWPPKKKAEIDAGS